MSKTKIFRNFGFLLLIQGVHANGKTPKLAYFCNSLMPKFKITPLKFFSALPTGYIRSETSGSLFDKGFVYTTICTCILIHFNLYV